MHDEQVKTRHPFHVEISPVYHVNEEHFSPLATSDTPLVSKKQRRIEEREWLASFRHKTGTQALSYLHAGIFFSVWNLINDVLSPGTLSMSQLVAQSGLPLSLILFPFFGILTTYTLIVLYNLARFHHKTSLPELCRLAFGEIGYYITCLLIFIFNFGGVLGMFLMFAQVVPDLLVVLYGQHHLLIGREAVLIYLTIFLLPIASMRELSDFAIVSFISVASVLIIALMLAHAAIVGNAFDPLPPDAWAFAKPEALSALGGLSFIFVCHDLSFNVFGALRHSNKRRYFTVVSATMILTVVTCLVMGVGGYLLFFGMVYSWSNYIDLNVKEGNVLNLLSRHSMMGIIGRCLLTLDLALCIPYTAFMPRYSLVAVLQSAAPSLFKTPLRESIVHYTSTILVVSSALGIALVVRDLGVVSEITGGISACSIAYIIPPLLFLKLSPKSWLGLEKWINVIVLLLGIGIFICSSASVVYHMFNK